MFIVILFDVKCTSQTHLKKKLTWINNIVCLNQLGLGFFIYCIIKLSMDFNHHPIEIKLRNPYRLVQSACYIHSFPVKQVVNQGVSADDAILDQLRGGRKKTKF